MARPKKTTDYTPPEGWEGSVIVELERPNYRQSDGKRLSTPWLQTIEPSREWPALVLNLNGMIINEVKYLPEGARTMEEIIETEKKRQEKRFGKK